MDHGEGYGSAYGGGIGHYIFCSNSECDWVYKWLERKRSILVKPRILRSQWGEYARSILRQYNEDLQTPAHLYHSGVRITSYRSGENSSCGPWASTPTSATIFIAAPSSSPVRPSHFGLLSSSETFLLKGLQITGTLLFSLEPA